MTNIFALCRNKGILFVAIDTNRPLLDQGPFDVVLHKVSVGFLIETLIQKFVMQLKFL